MKARTALLLVALSLALAGFTEIGRGLYIHSKAALAQHLLRDAWERTLAGGRTERPWPWSDTWPVARLVVPRTGTDLVVLAGTDGASLPFGPGHLPGSASPGMPGDSVLSGHRDTHFSFLRELVPGDALQLYTPDGAMRNFLVTETRVLPSSRVPLMLDGPEPRLLLTTCYPFDAIRPGGPERFLAVAEPAGLGQAGKGPRP